MAEVLPPTADRMMEVAMATLSGLPVEMQTAASRVAFRIEEFADANILNDMGIENPFQLTGLYQGIPLTDDSVSFPAPESPIVFLYRQPLLAEWCERGDVDFDELVAHVVIHELGHHFGWSDEDMHRVVDGDEA